MLATSQRATARPNHVSIELHPIPPFSLSFSAWAIRRRPSNLVDRWDGVTYGRVIMVDGRPAHVEVAAAGTTAHPILHVTASGASATRSTRATVTDETTPVASRIRGPRPPSTTLSGSLVRNANPAPTAIAAAAQLRPVASNDVTSGTSNWM